MTNARVSRLRRKNAELRNQVDLLSQIAVATDTEAVELPLYELIQAEAVDLVGSLTAMKWLGHSRFREVASLILTEANGALDVLNAGGSLDDYRERELEATR